MLKKFVYGQPIPTEAVIEDISLSQEAVPYLTVQTDKEGKMTFSSTLNDEDIVYGLGEAPRGINKRGHIYESFNSDDPYHTEEKRSLYGSHNFIVVSGKTSYGIFVDCGAQVTFDIGYTVYDRLAITPSVKDFVLYIIEGDNAYDIICQFRRVIGNHKNKKRPL